MTRNVALVVLGVAVACAARPEARFQTGELEGFFRSPTEHIISRIEEPIVVREVRGRVVMKGRDEPLQDVLFEIRGPGIRKRIRDARTGDDGRFAVGRVPQGTYLFKATLNGFQSVIGTLIVSRQADRRRTIEVEMALGV